PSLESALAEADAVIVLVRHTEFVDFVPAEIAFITKARIAIDTVNALNANEWQKAGFQYHRLGDTKPPVSNL
ncbi:MAG TPA: UDP-N-acetyl-D-mannosamine dehydrogenase, partial [Anaerolineales bacterium]|nr:UDP-N-acetyl-D-mannosamine dehydrogenase [Anaerolineales bacterium]